MNNKDGATVGKLKDAIDQIKAEYIQAYDEHGSFNSLHEAYGVIKEEFDEMWFLIMNTKVFPKENIKKEAAQIAAMCLVVITDFEYISRNYKNK